MNTNTDIIIKSKDYRDKIRSLVISKLEENLYYTIPYIWDITIGVKLDGLEIKNMDTGHVFKQQENRSGYKTVTLTYGKKRHQHMVHRLVMESVLHLQNCEFYEVNHIDGNKHNNHINNLEWLTRPENLKHSIDNRLKTRQYGNSNGNMKYSVEDVKDIRELHTLGFRVNDIVKAFKADYNSISGIINGTRRKNG